MSRQAWRLALAAALLLVCVVEAATEERGFFGAWIGQRPNESFWEALFRMATWQMFVAWGAIPLALLGFTLEVVAPSEFGSSGQSAGFLRKIAKVVHRILKWDKFMKFVVLLFLSCCKNFYLVVHHSSLDEQDKGYNADKEKNQGDRWRKERNYWMEFFCFALYLTLHFYHTLKEKVGLINLYKNEDGVLEKINETMEDLGHADDWLKNAKKDPPNGALEWATNLQSGYYKPNGPSEKAWTEKAAKKKSQ
jgi:hypothetical protein